MLMRPHPQFLTRHDAPGRRELAYLAQQGAGPAVIWLGGFRSDMRATKAEALANWAAQEGRALLRFDYTGHGESGGSFDEATIAVWLADVLAMIAHAGGEKPILAGSSMGGWLMLLVADALGKQVTAMVGIAAAPDFTDWDFAAADRATIGATGRIERTSDYGYDPMVITRGFWQSGQANLKLAGEVAIDCPVRLIHGQCDPDVPWETSFKLADALRSSDVQTILVKDGDHRLSRDQDIALLIDVVGKLARSIRI
jgi:pimeloyl-ACP methyl ester carboxylesterase